MNILVSGSISYDEIMDFPGKFVDYLHPEKLHQINVSFVVDRLEKQIGGTATNIAYNISLNKIDSIKILGAIGKDGQRFLDFFKKNKIDISGIYLDKKLYSAFGSVITDIKDNQIWGFYYGASKLARKVTFKKHLNKNNFLVISPNHPQSLLYFQREAIKNRIDYMYDPGMTLTKLKDKDIKEGVMKCKYLIGNDYEIAMILKTINLTIKELTNRGLNIITTLGEKGVRYENKKEKIEIKGYKVRKVVDPTGAGDAWRGGFITGLTKEFDIKQCLKLGNVMASFAIEKYGTVNHKPSIKDIEKRLNSL